MTEKNWQHCLSDAHSTFRISCSTVILLSGGQTVAKQDKITQGCSLALKVFCKGPPDSSSLGQIMSITEENSTHDS